jgi:hypothetical protein
MGGYMSLQEQADKDFTLARRKAWLGRVGARLRRNNAASQDLLCFEEVSRFLGAAGRVYRGRRTVSPGQIVGSAGRCADFDRDFLPAKASVETRWKRIDKAFHRGEELPPVSLYKIGGVYFVLDGNHRVSVYRYHGVEWIDADVTEFRVGLWSERGGKGNPIQPAQGGPKVREMMDLEVWKQRHEEMMREAEQDRLAKALRHSRKLRGASRASSLMWELKRIAGRLRKRLRSLRNVN